MFRTQNLCPGSKNVSDSRQKHFLFSEQQNLFPQHMFPARLNWETMFPNLARPLKPKIFQFHFVVLQTTQSNVLECVPHVQHDYFF